jgi:hypothetical protein
MSLVGTNRTINDVRSSVANGGEPDMARAADLVVIDPQTDISQKQRSASISQTLGI